MKPFLMIITILLYSYHVHSFSILGKWSLIELKDEPVLSESVDLMVEDLIFRQEEILQKLTFTGCQSYKYLTEIIDNNLYVQYDTMQLISQSQDYVCSNSVLSLHTSIQYNLKQAFYFKIFGNYLVLLSPKQEILFKFQRKIAKKAINLKGQWNIIRLNSVKQNQTVSFTDSQISLCSGALRISYNINDNYSIKTKLISNTGCNLTDIQNAFLQTNFFRLQNNSLDFYDSNVDLKISLMISNQLPNNTNSNNSTNLNNTIDNLFGKWMPTSVFGIPLSSSPISILFNANQIIYSGGCNGFIFQYTLNQTAHNLAVGQNRSSSNNCPVNDDGFYVNAISKISQYSITAINQRIALKLTDSQGNNIMELSKIVENNQSTSNSSSLSPQPSVQTQVVGLQLGRYVFLLLSRRDLPRNFCNVTSTKITYQGCNNVEQTFSIPSNHTIQINAGSFGNKTCSSNTDNIIANIFSSVKYFYPGSETGSYNLNDQNNSTVIYLSLL